MNIQHTILEARNALALCETLLLEAYIITPQPLANSIKAEMQNLAARREALAFLQHAAALLPPAEEAAAMLRTA